MFITNNERATIDGVIDSYLSAGIDLSGVNWDNPVIMGSIKSFFKKIGKGIKNVAQKIKQRIKERGITADVQTDQGKLSISPEGTTIKTDQIEASPRGLRVDTEKALVDNTQIETSSSQLDPKYFLIGGAAILLLLLLRKK